MARFLFAVWPFTGHVYFQLSLAQASRNRGHECRFYTGTKAARFLDQERFELFPFRRIDENQLWKDLFSPNDTARHWAGMGRFTASLRKWLIDTLEAQIEDMAEVLGSWEPDIVVCDPTLWGPILLSEKYPMPVAAASSVAACMVPGPDAPPFGLGLPRPRDRWTRLWARAASWVSGYMTRDFRERATAVRRKYGLPPLDVPVMTYTARLPMHIVPTAPELDYERRDLPPSVKYVGPCVWTKPRDAAPPPWLSEIRRDRPWVHVTEGSVHVDEPFLLRAAVAGLADLEVEVIMTTGLDRDPAGLDLGPGRPNIHVHRWVPHDDLLPKTSVVVTTGGAGTTMAALALGVPVISIPTEWDKPEMAQRVVEAGCGLRISPRHCRPRALRNAVRRVLDDPTFTQNARRMAGILARYGGARRAAELLGELALSRAGKTASGASTPPEEASGAPPPQRC